VYWTLSVEAKGEAGECICISPLRGSGIMETIREDSRFEDLAHEEATISAVVRERLKQFRSKN